VNEKGNVRRSVNVSVNEKGNVRRSVNVSVNEKGNVRRGTKVSVNGNVTLCAAYGIPKSPDGYIRRSKKHLKTAISKP
ncbi:MAG TPA: hypothetical protein PK230_03260, partial [Chitinophagales bacterium]|nr:hypothetical protein [Chitinophagales bacterium]